MPLRLRASASLTTEPARGGRCGQLQRQLRSASAAVALRGERLLRRSAGPLVSMVERLRWAALPAEGGWVAVRGLAGRSGSAGAGAKSDRCQAPPPRGHPRSSGCGPGRAVGRELLRGAAGGGPRPGQGWALPDSSSRSRLPSALPCSAVSPRSPGTGEHVSAAGGATRS